MTDKSMLMNVNPKSNFNFIFVPYIISIWIRFSTKTDRAIAMKKLLEKRTTRQPHPHARIYGPVGVEQQFVKNLRKNSKVTNNE